MKILIATTNPGKIREFRDMLGGEKFQWDDLSHHPGFQPVEETGETFLQNACLKAMAYAKQFNTHTLADDSGLEVDALGGSPGVHSARWAEFNKAGKGDADNNDLLIHQLDKVPDEKRTARFVCVLALASPDGQIVLTSRDTVEGRILREERGENGFGYDPLFLIDTLGKTTAELEPTEKHQISHRGKALRRLRDLMERNKLI
ncbi:MAG TPA: RdgB/HAM1 family non-canonical purine NTP pyrophosphatase [Tepidisphaeraceae bacterium]|jgi:XTP/dITP diphosphohydrolase|nr:RdgB/HAM1 family non-canonical purine NTP pyrophosphatase [Tepidisphaeraceae bacterium]